MLDNNDKALRKIYIEQTLKENRRYFGYRMDLVLYKLLLTIVFSVIIFISSDSMMLTILSAVQIFLIFTLINKLIIDSKAQKGKKILIEKTQLEVFKNKLINNSNQEFETFLKIYLNHMRYRNVQKAGNNIYSAEKAGESVIISTYRFYDGAVIERTDIRNLIQYIYESKADRAIVLSVNELTEDADKLLKDYSEKLNIKLIDIDELFEFARDNSLLSSNVDLEEYIKQYKSSKEKKDIVVSNFLLKRKIVIYIMSAVLFYVLYSKFTHNILGLYISYYFVVIAVISLLYNLIKLLKTRKTT